MALCAWAAKTHGGAAFASEADYVTYLERLRSDMAAARKAE